MKHGNQTADTCSSLTLRLAALNAFVRTLPTLLTYQPIAPPQWRAAADHPILPETATYTYSEKGGSPVTTTLADHGFRALEDDP